MLFFKPLAGIVIILALVFSSRWLASSSSWPWC